MPSYAYKLACFLQSLNLIYLYNGKARKAQLEEAVGTVQSIVEDHKLDAKKDNLMFAGDMNLNALSTGTVGFF